MPESARSSKALVSVTKKPHASDLGNPPSSARRDQLPRSPAPPSLTTYKTTNTRHMGIMFPLEAYAFGPKIFESVNPEEPIPKLWVRIQDIHVFIVEAPIESGHVLLDLELGRDIRNAQVSPDQSLVFLPMFFQITSVVPVPDPSR